MAVSLDVTVSGENSNSYGSLSQADNYFEYNATFTAWGAFTDDQKTQWLVLATRGIDRLFNYVSTKADDDQALEFPRYGQSSTVIEPKVFEAQMEMLIYLYYHKSETTGLFGTPRQTRKVNVYQTVSIEFENQGIKESQALSAFGGSIETISNLLSDWANTSIGSNSIVVSI